MVTVDSYLKIKNYLENVGGETFLSFNKNVLEINILSESFFESIKNIPKKDLKIIAQLNDKFKGVIQKRDQQPTFLEKIEKIFSYFQNFHFLRNFVSSNELGRNLSNLLSTRIQEELDLRKSTKEQKKNSDSTTEEDSEEFFTPFSSSSEDDDSFLNISDQSTQKTKNNDSTPEEDSEEFFTPISSSSEEESINDISLEENMDSKSLSEEISQEEMLPSQQLSHIFLNAWQNASQSTTTLFHSAIKGIFKDANIVACVPSGNELLVQLKEEVSGRDNPNYGILLRGRLFSNLPGQAVLKKQIKLKFEEIFDDTAGCYKQVLSIVNGGFVYRAGGYFTPDVEITQLVTQHYPEDELPTLSVGAGKFGKTAQTIVLDDAANVVEFWQNFNWSK